LGRRIDRPFAEAHGRGKKDSVRLRAQEYDEALSRSVLRLTRYDPTTRSELSPMNPKLNMVASSAEQGLMDLKRDERKESGFASGTVALRGHLFDATQNHDVALVQEAPHQALDPVGSQGAAHAGRPGRSIAGARQKMRF